MILTDFCHPDPFHVKDPDPAGRNETDPNGSGSETLDYEIKNQIKKYQSIFD